ncbi:MAG: GAF domain-containing protein [Chloroflexota bacterium]
MMNIENQLRDELSRTKAELLAVLAVGQALRASRDLPILYRTVATQLANVIEFDVLFIGLYQPKTEEMLFVYGVDEGVVDDLHVRRPLSQTPLNQRVVRERQAVYIEDLDNDPVRQTGLLIPFGKHEKRSKAWLCAPMISGDTVHGVLCIQSYQPSAFTEADIELLLLLASHISVAVDNAQLFTKLQRTIVELSTPVIPVAEGVLILPLIGTIDSERATRLVEQTLDSINEKQAQQLLIDVTGITSVDTFVIDQLMKLVRAAALLGTTSSIVGVSATMAQQATELELDLGGIKTFNNLQSALMDVLR